MAVVLSQFAGVGAQFFDNNGVPLAGGKIYSYQAGTTTPQATYTTNAGDVPRTNPIFLDAAGRVPGGGEIWITVGLAYKFVVTTSTDVPIATYDNVPSAIQPPVANDAENVFYEQGFTVTAGSFVVGKTYRILTLGNTDFTLIGAVSNTIGLHFIATGAGTGTGTAEFSQTVEAKFQQTVSVKDFGAVGDGVADDTSAVVAAIASVGDFGEIYFPEGNYRLTSSIATRPGLSFIGYGATITVPGSVDLFITTSNGFPGRISFFGLKFVSSGLTSRAIYLNNNSPFLRVSDCIFEGFDVAIYLENSYTSLIERCRFTSNKYGTIVIKAVATTHFQSCFYDYNQKAGIAINGNSGGPLHGNQFLTPNIRIESTALQNSEYGLWAEFVEDLELSSVYFEGNSINDANIGAPATGGGVNRFCRGVNLDGAYFNSSNIINLRLRSTSRSKFLNLSFLTNTGTTQPKVSAESGCTDLYIEVIQCDSGSVTSTWPVDASAVPTEVITKILGVEYIPINYVRSTYGVPGNNGMQIRRRTTPSVGRPALSIESLGTQHDVMFKYTDVLRMYNASDVEQFSVSHVAGQVYSIYPVRTVAVTVANLPSASAQGSGARAFVSDANATTFASIVAAGGSNRVPVYSDGTNWRIG